MARRVLIVEDNDSVRATWSDALQMLGYEVTAVDDGARALESIAHHQPDAILLDLVMPAAEIDGFEFLSRLRAGVATLIPVVIVSGLGEPLAAAATDVPVTPLGITTILSKPVDLADLARAMDRAIASGDRACPGLAR